MRFRLLDKIQSNEQWTEENCIKVAGSIQLLKHTAKYLLKTPSNNKNHQAQKEGAGVMTTVFSDLNAENLCSPSLKQNALRCSSLSLRSIKESSVTRSSFEDLEMAFFFFLHKEAEEPPIFKSCSNGMKSDKSQSYVQKHPILFQIH